MLEEQWRKIWPESFQYFYNELRPVNDKICARNLESGVNKNHHCQIANYLMLSIFLL
jgi:hypothetical protein